jgi:galactokinase
VRSVTVARRLDGPASRWRAPGRVNLIGEHTDYNQGFVLPLAIGFGVTATVRPRSDAWLHLTSAQAASGEVIEVSTLAPGAVHGWAAYVAGVWWALHQGGWRIGGADVHVDGDVPVGAGLSSSAALECSVASAAAEVFGLGLSRPELVQVTRRSENDFVGVPNGIMDQSASMLATAGNALFLDARTLKTEQVPFALSSHGLAMLVIDSKTPHALVDGEYAARRRSCEAAAATLGVPALRDVPLAGLEERLQGVADEQTRRRARHVVTENGRVLDTVALLQADRPDAIGSLLTASHVSMRDDFEITSDRVDLAVDVALRAGALGARMTGGGFGGCVIALVQSSGPSGPAAVAAAVEAAFAAKGYASPVPFVVQAEAGAHRVAATTG